MVSERTPGEGKTPEKRRSRLFSLPLLVGTILLGLLLVTGLEYQHAAHPGGSTNLMARVIVVFLFNIDVVLAVLLLYVLLRNVAKVYWNRSGSGFGSGFQARLIGSFLLMVLIPSLLLFIVASGFLNTSVQRWFSFPVSDSLRASASVSREYYREVRRDALRTARALAGDLVREERRPDGDLGDFLEEKKKELDLAGLEVYRRDTGGAKRLARAVDLNVRLLDAPRGEDLASVPEGGTTRVTRTGVGDLVRAFLPVTLPRKEGTEVLVVDAFVPEAFSRKLGTLTHAFSDYRELRQFRNPIRQSYLLVFFMITMMIIFGAIWFGLFLARRITRPLLALEKATEEVARGNLSVRVPLTGEEEFGVLVESFNQMTSDLALSSDRSKGRDPRSFD